MLSTPDKVSPTYPSFFTKFHTRWSILIWVLLAIAVLGSRLYLTMIRAIYFFDESLYLAQTQAMAEQGVMVAWAWNPGVAFLNIPWYLFFRSVPLALDYTSRFAFFLSSITAFGLIALIVNHYTRKTWWSMIAVGLALSAHPFWNFVPNSSDSYYTVILLLFMVVIEYALRHSPTHWSWFITAGLLAFSTTIRNDGTIVYALATCLYAWHLWHARLSWKVRLGTGLVVWVFPIMLLLIGYRGIAIARGGFYDAFYARMEAQETSVSERTYVAFEQGEGRTQRYTLAAQGKVWWSDGQLLARELYGTPEENGYSVFRAIANNPSAWLDRVKWNVRDFFLSWQEAFWNHGPPIFIAALWGWGLMGCHRPKSALIFLLVLAPTSFFFLITFWQARYIIILAPIWIILGVYSLSVMAQPPTPKERGWGIALAFVTGGAIAIFYLVGNRRDVPFPSETVLWTLLLYSIYIWRFVWQPKIGGMFSGWRNLAAILFLVVGTYRVPPYAEWQNTPYHYESSAYITHAHYFYPRERVCVAFRDLDALSLVWYARQIPVPSSLNIRDELINGTLSATMDRNQCGLALIALTGWSDQALINDPMSFSNTNAHILFESDMGTIVLFDLSS